MWRCDGESETERLVWVWGKQTGSWFPRQGKAYQRERSVVHNEDDVGGRARVTRDEKRVLQGGMRQTWGYADMKVTSYLYWVTRRILSFELFPHGRSLVYMISSSDLTAAVNGRNMPSMACNGRRPRSNMCERGGRFHKSDIEGVLRSSTPCSMLDFWDRPPRSHTFDCGRPPSTGFVVEHFCVKFGDPSCVGFWDIVLQNRHTDRQTNGDNNPTSATAVRAGKAGILRIRSGDLQRVWLIWYTQSIACVAFIAFLK